MWLGKSPAGNDIYKCHNTWHSWDGCDEAEAFVQLWWCGTDISERAVPALNAYWQDHAAIVAGEEPSGE